MEQEGVWLPIIEYAEYRGISISTIRRYIKGNQVKYIKEDGKYKIFVSGENLNRKKTINENIEIEQKLKIELLETKIQHLEEENNDLKMLVQIYENKKENSQILPEVPLS